jgi:transcriptional regulator with XRE-family HTH domain
MPTLFNSLADQLVRSEVSLDFATSASSIDVFIGSRVRSRRTSRGMTQQELSELLGIDCDSVAAHEAGAERINARLLFQIAKLVNVQPDYLFSRVHQRWLKGRLRSKIGRSLPYEIIEVIWD